jgi:uncharacterized protein (TIGR00297 family)
MLALASPLTHLEATIVLAVIAVLSLKLRFLDPRGVIASIVVGYIIIVLGGLNYFAILLAFFIISSAVTRLRVRAVGELPIDKEWIRSWRNVLANGLAPTLAILIPRILSCDERVMAAGYLGAVGTAFADTLATEIGLFYRGKPRLITSFEKVEKGTPGAVSPYGYLGCIIALLMLAAFSWILGAASPQLALMLIPAGVIGTTIDSLLGAGVQGKYRCRECGRIVENPHHCGQPAEHFSGVRWMSTHMVNLISTILGALILAALAALL